MAPALDEVDRVDVVRVDDARPTQPAHDLREDVSRDLAPRELFRPERRHRDRHRGVDVPWGNESGDPSAQSEPDGESEVDRQGVLWIHKGG